MNEIDRLRVTLDTFKEDIEKLRQEVWIEWCYNALKEYDDSIYQGIIRGVLRFDSKELKGYKCFIQKRLIKKEKFDEVLGRLKEPNDIEIIESGHGGTLLIMGSGFIEKNNLKLDQHSVLVFATTKVQVKLYIVEEIINELEKRI